MSSCSLWTFWKCCFRCGFYCSERPMLQLARRINAARRAGAGRPVSRAGQHGNPERKAWSLNKFTVIYVESRACSQRRCMQCNAMPACRGFQLEQDNNTARCLHFRTEQYIFIVYLSAHLYNGQLFTINIWPICLSHRFFVSIARFSSLSSPISSTSVFSFLYSLILCSLLNGVET